MNLLKSYELPIEVFNEASGKYANQHWRAKHRRHTKQKMNVVWGLREITIFANKRVHVRLIRISSKKLDCEDNLPYAFKWIKDAIADILIPGLQAGRADDSDLIDWSYGQEKGKPKEKGMRVEVYGREE